MSENFDPKGAENMEIVDSNPNNWLIKFFQPDGSTRVELVSKSPYNRLLYDHGLWGLLNDHSEDFVILREDEPDITVAPDRQSERETFWLDVGFVDKAHIAEHQKEMLVEALADAAPSDYDPSDTTFSGEPLVKLYEKIREGKVRAVLAQRLADEEPFSSSVEMDEDGWIINGHLLLTWDNEFYHPNVSTSKVRGSAVSDASSEEAYDISVGSVPDGISRNMELSGEEFRLTTSEMRFIAKALWAIFEAPSPTRVQDKVSENEDNLRGTPGLNRGES